jgi:hypothetical protein
MRTEEDLYNQIIKEKEEITSAYKYSIMTLLFNSMLLLSSIVFLVFSLSYKSPTQYIHADENGRIMKDVPISEFNESPEETGQWVADALKSSFTYNFTNLETHPSQVKKLYTERGFKKYKNQFERSTTKVFVKENKAVAFAGRIAAPTLLADLTTKGGLAIRKYETVMNQVMQGYEGKRIETYKVTVIVVREEIKNYKDGKAIGSIISERVNEK